MPKCTSGLHQQSRSHMKTVYQKTNYVHPRRTELHSNDKRQPTFGKWPAPAPIHHNPMNRSFLDTKLLLDQLWLSRKGPAHSLLFEWTRHPKNLKWNRICISHKILRIKTIPKTSASHVEQSCARATKTFVLLEFRGCRDSWEHLLR